MAPSLARMLWLAAFACSVPLALAHTQPPIYRCVGAHGEPKFSSQPCGPEALPAGSATTAGIGADRVCAASPQALRTAIATAFASHDVNGLAGLIVWRGIDQDAARTRLRSLSEWLQQPLAGIAIRYPTGPPFADSGAAPALPGSADGAAGPSLVPDGFEISTGDGRVRVFGVVESDGCWWLSFD